MLSVKLNYLNILLLFLLWLDCVTSNGQYECGEHGRFEYCIDEIPGCVIGCHCHPGYYFDTDTKICEPNTKLTQNYRRHYTIEPSSSEIPFITFESTQPTPLVTVDPIDSQVDEITKNTDDLGDWLYNQFFKTIENQVINNTNANDSILTRRNGGGPIKNMSQKRLSRKKNKKSRQRRRKSSMRRKILRITENDSVFDTSEESRSDSSDSSSDESDTTFEVEQSEDKHKNDKEHGHKKIVIINKKPKPQLPSFIFLPNMDTPFYPPIGLPPPPVMPMYPIVPVPPMPAMVYPCPEEASGPTTLPSTTVKAPTSGIPTFKGNSETTTFDLAETENPTQSTISDMNSDLTTQPEPEKSGRAGLYKKKNKASSFKQHGKKEPYASNKRKLVQGNRQKLLQQLRQSINNPAKLMPPYNSLKFNEEEMLETPLTEDNMIDETFNNEIQSNPNRYSNPKPENVDFKYISELIHRVDLNNTHDLPPIEYNSKNSVEVFKERKPYKIKNQEFNTPKETRRSNSDDSYYTNLGRQIASIIRNADAQNQQIDIEIEHTEKDNENHVFFNDNSPRSFWERSVRSPLKFLNSNKNKYDYLKKSNELLFNIENKVTLMASTVPTLTLQEIENIVNIMEKAQKKIKNKQNHSNKDKSSDSNLNFNLWPPENQNARNSFSKVILNPERKTIIKQSSAANINSYKKMPELQGLSVHNIQRVTAWLTTNKNNRTYNAGFNALSKPLRDLKPSDTQITMPKPVLQSAPTEQRNNISHLLKSSKPQHDYYSLPNNNIFKGMNKYFQDSHSARNNDGLTLHMKPVRQLINKPIDQQPSYFHHEINHFGYFD